MPAEYETMLIIGGKDDHEQDATHVTHSLGIEPVVIPEMKRAIDLKQDRAAYRKMKAIIQDYKPDIVHTHAAKSGAIGRLAASACKVPVIVHTFHGHVFHSYFGKAKTQVFIEIERYLAKKSSGIIAISDIQKGELAQQFRICKEEKLTVIPLGLDLDKFAENQETKRKNFREKFGFGNDEILIGIVGRVVSVKNHAMFVAAAARVAAATTLPVRFVIIGDGDARPSMEAQFAAAGITYSYFPENKTTAQAVCISWQTEMDVVMAGLDIIALTSHNEGTPVSLIEAQAASRPVVSTNVGGVADVVVEGRSGYVVQPGDLVAFAERLLSLVNDEGQRKEFGRHGRDFVLSRFAYQRLVKDMDAYYKKLLAGK